VVAAGRHARTSIGGAHRLERRVDALKLDAWLHGGGPDLQASTVDAPPLKCLAADAHERDASKDASPRARLTTPRSPLRHRPSVHRLLMSPHDITPLPGRAAYLAGGGRSGYLDTYQEAAASKREAATVKPLSLEVSVGSILQCTSDASRRVVPLLPPLSPRRETTGADLDGKPWSQPGVEALRGGKGRRAPGRARGTRAVSPIARQRMREVLRCSQGWAGGARPSPSLSPRQGGRSPDR
jgi:hypothetical protein